MIRLVCVVVAGGLLVGCSKPKAVKPAASYAHLIAAKDLDGAVVGSRPDKRATVVVFFATWCTPCRQELELLDGVRRHYERVRIIGVNAYEEWSNRSDQTRLRAYVNSHASWLQVVRADKRMFHVFGGVPKIPSMFIFDAGGRLLKAFRRDRRPPPTRAEIDQVLVKWAGRS